jgi:hypothetical protein
VFISLLLVLMLAPIPKTKFPKHAYSIAEDAINLNNKNEKSFIIYYEDPYCSTCLKLLSNKYGSVYFSDSINKFVLKKWKNSVSTRRYSLIFNQKNFPSFQTVFTKDTSFITANSLKTPIIVLWDGKKNTIIGYDSIFGEDRKGIVFINEFIEKMISDFNNKKSG